MTGAMLRGPGVMCTRLIAAVFTCAIGMYLYNISYTFGRPFAIGCARRGRPYNTPPLFFFYIFLFFSSERSRLNKLENRT